MAHNCPGEPEHRKHATATPEQTDEVSSGWCDILAKAYAQMGPEWAAAALPQVTINEFGTVDPSEPQSKKRRREEENESALGGLRNPERAVQKVKGWYRADPQAFEAAYVGAVIAVGVFFAQFVVRWYKYNVWLPPPPSDLDSTLDVFTGGL